MFNTWQCYQFTTQNILLHTIRVVTAPLNPHHSSRSDVQLQQYISSNKLHVTIKQDKSLAVNLELAKGKMTYDAYLFTLTLTWIIFKKNTDQSLYRNSRIQKLHMHFTNYCTFSSDIFFISEFSIHTPTYR